MGPVKFDDFSKTAKDLLTEDYQIGYQFKAKQKTNLEGATVTSTLDLWPPKEAAKITWKFPRVFGLAGIVLDKLELDKKGLVKLEASADKGLHSVPDLKIEAKSDLLDPASATTTSSIAGATIGLTYTGIKNTQVKLDAKPAKKSCTVELCHAMNGTMFGMKLGTASMDKPDFALRHVTGPLFVSFLAKELATFTAHCHFNVSDELKFACTYQHGGKQSGDFGLGLAHTVQKGTSLKLKVTQDMNVQAGLKHEVTPGFTMLAGCKYETQTGMPSFGLQVSID